jgi:AraC family transcriptional regulator of adaptative response/methylated-DNA-[protein]-cysteine methyltransferase
MNQYAPHIPESDYASVQAAIAHISDTPADALDMGAFAHALGKTERQLTDLFRRWCGLTPKSFAQAVALDHAKRLLRDNATMLDTTFEVGLSSASRLHDLFVTHMAMPPGAWRERGKGLSMRWGVAPSPFGLAVLVVSDYGLAGIGFAEQGDVEAGFNDLRSRWPEADYSRNDAEIAPIAAQIFDPARWDANRPVRVVLIGTDFEVRVWETLLKIPLGSATTYGTIANHLGKPTAARAVGAAVGRNPISFVVPCHRVVGSTGQLTGYHWGIARKRAILGWEAGVAAS